MSCPVWIYQSEPAHFHVSLWDDFWCHIISRFTFWAESDTAAPPRCHASRHAAVSLPDTDCCRIWRHHHFASHISSLMRLTSFDARVYECFISTFVITEYFTPDIDYAIAFAYVRRISRFIVEFDRIASFCQSTAPHATSMPPLEYNTILSAATSRQ